MSFISLQRQLKTLARLLCLLTSLLCLSGLNLGCDDEPARCEQDSDCREGYRCDQKIYVGECVQLQDVIACGPTLCFYPQERCIQDECVEADDLDDMTLPLAGQGPTGAGEAGATLGGTLGGGGAGVSEPLAGEVDGGSGVEGGSSPVEELRVEWLRPEEGSLLPLSDQYSVSGVVRYGDEQVSGAQSVSVELSWLSALNGPSQGAPQQVLVGDQGRFEASLALPPGAVTLIAEVNAFGQTAQALLQLTIDDFVTPQGAQLTWAGEVYRGLGLDLPQLLPWLSSQDEEQRSAALDALWSSLRGKGLRYIRTFIGWTRGAGATLAGPQAFAPEGISLLDELIESAARGGVKLIFVLADPSRELVGYEDHLRWSGLMNPALEDEARVYYTGLAREQLLNAMSLFPARQNERTGRFYRDEPTIMGWELLYRPSWAGLSVEDNAQVSSFMREAMERLRSAAPRQLLWSGEVGFDRNPTPYGEHAAQLESIGAGGLLTGLVGGRWAEHLSYDMNISSVALDVEHSFIVNPAQWSAFGSAWLRGHALAHFTLAPRQPISVTHARLSRVGVAPAMVTGVMSAWSNEAFSQGYSLFTLSEFALPEEGRSGGALWTLGEASSDELLEALSARWRQD